MSYATVMFAGWLTGMITALCALAWIEKEDS